ncbi:MAG: universal stress protein [Thermoleophilaceae bacterium]
MRPSTAPRLLVGLDGTPPATEALARAADIARRHDGHLRVVMVLRRSWLADLSCFSPASVPQAFVEEAWAEALRRAIASLPPDVGVRSVVRRGGVVAALAAEADAGACDSILIGARHGWRSRRLATVLRRRCGVPVEVVGP